MANEQVKMCGIAVTINYRSVVGLHRTGWGQPLPRAGWGGHWCFTVSVMLILTSSVNRSCC